MSLWWRVDVVNVDVGITDDDGLVGGGGSMRGNPETVCFDLSLYYI